MYCCIEVKYSKIQSYKAEPHHIQEQPQKNWKTFLMRCKRIYGKYRSNTKVSKTLKKKSIIELTILTICLWCYKQNLEKKQQQRNHFMLLVHCSIFSYVGSEMEEWNFWMGAMITKYNQSGPIIYSNHLLMWKQSHDSMTKLNLQKMVRPNPSSRWLRLTIN